MRSSVTSEPTAATWWGRYQQVRRLSERICEPLEIEDYVVQSMPEASPIRWHLAHTTWFFETFLLRARSWYRPLDERFERLFNSYYNGVGTPPPRERRGLITRPTVAEVQQYRRHVDQAMQRWLFDWAKAGNDSLADGLHVLEIGLNHEQQHQELMLTDLKHALSCNPLFPVLDDRPLARPATPEVDAGEPSGVAEPRAWTESDGGIYSIGHAGEGFAFDNESPRHEVLEMPFRMGRDLVRNDQWFEFIGAGGYRRPELWLSMGWDWVQREQVAAPLYWHQIDDCWFHFTYAGLQPVDPNGLVAHVSYFEADAFARWAGARLPTESQWEIAAAGVPVEGNFADDLIDRGLAIHPTPANRLGPRPAAVEDPAAGVRDLYGTLWQWTSSPYSAYPGYRAPAGTLGEYNGKFMCNQFVLRGGSCASPRGHLRATYRNFFAPHCRWQFTGVRLAADA